MNYFKYSQSNVANLDNSHQNYLNSKKLDIITKNGLGAVEAPSYSKVIPKSDKIERLK